MKVKELFAVKYGVNLELTNCDISDCDNAINFVSRASTNNGVVARVKRVDGVEPQKAGTISCAASGFGVLCSFVQTSPYYSGRDLFVLTPLKDMTFAEKQYYCMCLRANAYRYAWNRQANKTLRDIELPDTIPKWVYEIDVLPIKTAINNSKQHFNVSEWHEIKLVDYFDMFAGKYYAKDDYQNGNIPYVSASDTENGILNTINIPAKFKGNCLTIGKVGCTTYYQPNDFCATSDVTILKPKQTFNKYIGLFLATVINMEKSKWSYGRQIRLGDSKELIIKLPITPNGKPDWDYMENYIKSLPYSDRI